MFDTMLESTLSELSEMYKFITVGQLRQEIFAPEVNLYRCWISHFGTETCVSGDFLQENVVQSKIFVEMLAKNIN